MDFSYPPEVEQFRKELRAWLAANLTDEVVAANRGRRSGRSGISDSSGMERDDGRRRLGRGLVAAGVRRPRGRRCSSSSSTPRRPPAHGCRCHLNVIGMNNIAPAIMQYGTEAQKRTLLPRMMRADDIWCQGMSEPEAGSDLASLRTRAVRDWRATSRRQRPEDLDLTGAPGQLVSAVRAHRPGRAEAQGHLLPDSSTCRCRASRFGRLSR